MPVLPLIELLRSETACCSASVSCALASESDVVECESYEHVESGERKELVGRVLVASAMESRETETSCLPVLAIPSTLVGHLTLWNRSSHRLDDLPVIGNCLALTDSSATICCVVVRNVSSIFLGRVVRVISWNYIPWGYLPNLKTAERRRNLNRTRATDLNFEEERRCGLLEIHKMELAENCLPTLSTFAKLCRSPCSAETRSEVFESPKFRVGSRRSRLSTIGVLMCMSPGFILPCKMFSKSAGEEQATGGKINVKGNNSPSNAQLMKGFFAELQHCPSCSSLKQHNEVGPGCGGKLEQSSVSSRSTETAHVAPSEADFLSRSLHSCKTFLKCELQFTPDGNRIDSQKRRKHVTWSLSPGCEPANKMPCRVLPTENSHKHQCLCSRCRNLDIVHVYFSGSVAAWRSVLSGALGDCITISGLRKKVLLAGGGYQYTVLVATRTSLVSLSHDVKLRVTNQIPSNLVEKTNRSACRLSNGTLAIVVDRDISKVNKGGCRRNLREWKSADCTPEALATGGNNNKAQESATSFTEVHGRNSFGDSSGEDLATGVAKTGGFICQYECRVKSSQETYIRLGSYIGIVSDVFMRGMLVELDNRVLLLLTHQKYNQTPGLRVGAMVSLREVHIITVKSKMEKFLLLGACFRSHVFVMAFSPVNTRQEIWELPHPLINKFVEPLCFTSALWVLLVLASFREKFDGNYNEKELLGSKKEPGIVQRYVHKFLPADAFFQRDVFQEFFSHDKYCRLGVSSTEHMLQIPPIANFYRYLEALSRELWTSVYASNNLEGASYRSSTMAQIISSRGKDEFVQMRISSQELGVILIGSLKKQGSSGKLQLVDCTGEVHVVVPDFLATLHLHNFYEVSKFIATVEVLKDAVGLEQELGHSSPMSVFNILKGVNPKPVLSKQVACYVEFFMKDANQFPGLLG